jgi:hypothetical protein
VTTNPCLVISSRIVELYFYSPNTSYWLGAYELGIAIGLPFFYRSISMQEMNSRQIFSLGRIPWWGSSTVPEVLKALKVTAYRTADSLVPGLSRTHSFRRSGTTQTYCA